MIAAIGKNRELGKGNELLWRIPDDLKRVRMLTTGHPLVMGRKTFDSIVAAVGHPLPGRTNIVVTRDPNWQYDGITVVHSVEEGIEAAKRAQGSDEIFIFGGAQIYEAALPHANMLRLTLIDDTKEAESFFPPYEDQFKKVVIDEPHEHEGLKYRWVDLERE